jgi:aspartyl-tRNA(Asn)/glutamyl-tRNA(Gln) amidotransferase subunit A
VNLREMANALRARQVSAVELTQSSLDRITKLNLSLNAFITVMAERGLASAKAADQELARGIDRGPLHGIPVAVKDLFYTKGTRTTAGSRIFANFVPEYDAAAVEKLASAGAVVVGKTGMHELAYGVTSTNPHYGAVRNPWDLERIPGGSSGGSGSAVAADIVAVALGSDTGGSIRIPASFCGVVGLKPTYGRVSRYGALPLAFSLDHMGPLARSVRETALTLNVLAGFDSRDPSSRNRPAENFVPTESVSIRDVRIGLPENFYFDSVSLEVSESAKRMAKTAESLGARISYVRLPDIMAINTLARVILLAEASALLEPYLSRRDDFGQDVLLLLDQGRLIPATHYVNAQRLRRVYASEFSSVWKQVDCLLAPTTPTTAPKIGQSTIRINGREEDVRIATTRLVRAVNALGVPCTVHPQRSGFEWLACWPADYRSPVPGGPDSESGGRPGGCLRLCPQT